MKRKDLIHGGLADKKDVSDFDPDALEQGITVEMEHTDDEDVAREIAMDHLTEDPDYYDKLEDIEKSSFFFERASDHLTGFFKAIRLRALPEPTKDQKEAGNYRKHHIRIHGLGISIENPKGSYRSGVSPDGKEWRNKLHHHYGYIRGGTIGNDKDHLDCFIGPDHESELVHVVNQIKPATGKLDEHKVMFGFHNREDARDGYHANYDDGWKGMHSIVSMTVPQFKEWIGDSDNMKKFAAGYHEDDFTKSSFSGFGLAVNSALEFFKGKKLPLGHVSTYADGSQKKKVAETGDPAKDWKLIKKPTKKKKSKKSKKSTKPGIAKKTKKKARVDTGAKITTARKYTKGHGDRYLDKVITVADLSEMTAEEKAKHIRKDSIWPPVKFDELAADVPPNANARIWAAAVFTVKKVRDSFAAAPPKHTALYSDYDNEAGHELSRQRYTELLSDMKEMLDDALIKIREDAAGNHTEPPIPWSTSTGTLDFDGQYRRMKTYLSQAVGGFKRVIGEKQIADTWHVIASRTETGEMDWQGKPRFRDESLCQMPVMIGKTMHGIIKNPDYRIGRIFSDGYGKVKFEEGKASLAKKKKSDEEGPHMRGKPIASIQRTGEDYRKGKNISEEKFLKTFGFAGVGYGNYVTQDERPMFLNHAYDGFMDLSRMIGVSPKAISLDGRLKIGFGISGAGKFAAHYQSSDTHINITKDSGAGALSHEWAHALDDYLKKTMLDDPRLSAKHFGVTDPLMEKKQYRLQTTEQGQKTKLIASMTDVMRAIEFQDPESAIASANEEIKATETRFVEREVQEMTNKVVKVAKENGFLYNEDKIARAVNGLADIVRGTDSGYSGWERMMDKAYEHLSTELVAAAGAERMKSSFLTKLRLSPHAASSRYKFKSSDFHNMVNYAGYTLSQAKKSLEQAVNGETVSQKPSALYAYSAKKGPYWKRPHELFARSFETYINDKVQAKGERSDFLVHTGRYDQSPAYPQGSQRTHINKAIENFVQAIDRSESSMPEIIKSYLGIMYA